MVWRTGWQPLNHSSSANRYFAVELYDVRHLFSQQRKKQQRKKQQRKKQQRKKQRAKSNEQNAFLSLKTIRKHRTGLLKRTVSHLGLKKHRREILK